MFVEIKIVGSKRLFLPTLILNIQIQLKRR